MEDKHELLSVNWGIIPIYNYNGTNVERLPKGFRVFGKFCNTPDEVDEIILNACSILNESIERGSTINVKVVNGNVCLSNTEK